MIIKTYTALMRLDTYEERLEYLMLRGTPAEETFGGLRHLNQSFYKSRQWRSIRGSVIVRDSGFDLGLVDRPIMGRVYVHHMNPVDPHILVHQVELALDPEYLITVSFDTHQIIHFNQTIPKQYVEHVRRPGDTTLW